MFSSSPEYIREVGRDREHKAQSALRSQAAQQMIQDERPRRAPRAWAHFISVRMPRSVRFLPAGRA